MTLDLSTATAAQVRAHLFDAVRRAGFDVAEVEKHVETAERCLDGDEMPVLQAIWYASVLRGKPDYSVYDTPYYLAEAYACFLRYSRKYVRALAAEGVLFDPGKPVRAYDLGCGVGLTSAMLRQVLGQKSEVVGTNFPGSTQWKVAEQLRAQHGFELRADVEQGFSVDVVFASEFFEHLVAPIDYLRCVLGRARPGLIIFANTFSSPSIGHFPSYVVDRERVDGRRTALAFTRVLQGYGYERCEEHRFWNNRPQVWRHKTRGAESPLRRSSSRTVGSGKRRPARRKSA